ncbi:hypothetical protein B8V54_06465 [Streptococcus agalactiae]|uniref:hypothetical protein n=1 Tax=Streptococcus agalactiae TaxID=1311 RepID=UPI001374D48A|nr:hypothetical protein [Streptococcus agalactiae]KAF1216482.1 hypothetical protein B8V54_06465 [Streptococcus agalactiae]KAF1228737.1 hypothetical protein B8V61_12410 [Streptococcus agalactiae]
MSKGYKVVDVGSNHEYDVTFCTCEVCMSYGNEVDNPYIVIEKPDGTKKEVDIYYWSWGDYFEYYIDNVVEFSAFLSEQDIDDEEFEDNSTSVIIDLINEYDWSKEKD